MRISRIKENEKFVLYQRERGHETWIPLYFIYSKDRGEQVEECRNILQAKKIFTDLSEMYGLK